MGRSQETFSKKDKEEKRLKKRKEKEQRRQERKAQEADGNLENMMAYVDEFGNIVDTPPDPEKKSKIKAEDIVVGVPKQEDIEASSIKTGRVDYFNEEKGYGFIKEVGTQESYFVHVKGMVDDVRLNDKVTFELEQGLKGLNAVNVKLFK